MSRPGLVKNQFISPNYDCSAHCVNRSANSFSFLAPSAYACFIYLFLLLKIVFSSCLQCLRSSWHTWRRAAGRRPSSPFFLRGKERWLSTRTGKLFKKKRTTILTLTLTLTHQSKLRKKLNPWSKWTTPTKFENLMLWEGKRKWAFFDAKTIFKGLKVLFFKISIAFLFFTRYLLKVLLFHFCGS